MSCLEVQNISASAGSADLPQRLCFVRMKIPAAITKKIQERISTHLVAIHAEDIVERVRPTLLLEAEGEAQRILDDAECAAEFAALKSVERCNFKRAWQLYGGWEKARRESEAASVSNGVKGASPLPKSNQCTA